MRTTLVLLAVLLLAPAAHAQQRSASTTDPAGDTGPGATDLTSLQATYDPAGSLQVVVGFAEPFAETGSVELVVHPRHPEQCEPFANGRGELHIDVNAASGTASGAYMPDTGAYPAGTATLSGDRRTLTVAMADGAIASRDFACVLALGEGYQDEWAGYTPGDDAFVQFPGFEKPQCRDGIDNDGDGDVDEADQGCEGLDDPSEALERLPTLSKRDARMLAKAFTFVRRGSAEGLRLRCTRRSRLAFRCRAGGTFRGTTLVKRVRVGGRYEDVARRFRIRRR